MAQPFVSVCVPTYNGNAFLAETLESIAAQTFDDYEVVIVDDNSTDDTVAIARQYAASDPRVRIFAPPERAGSSARNANRCLAYARGEWIKFIFQDDLMAPDCLAAMLDATRDGHRFALCWHDYRFEEGVSEETRGWYESLPSLRTAVPGTYASPGDFCEAVLAHWGKNFLGPTSSSFIHRDCFARHGSFSSENVSFPDLDCWIRMGQSEGLAIAPSYLVTFRVHATSISAGLRGSRLSDYRSELEFLRFHLDVASAPAHARLREHMRAHAPPMDPGELLLKRAKGTRWLAIDARNRHQDPSLWEKWDGFVRAHPEVAALLREADRDEDAPRDAGVVQKLRSRLSAWLRH